MPSIVREIIISAVLGGAVFLLAGCAEVRKPAPMPSPPDTVEPSPRPVTTLDVAQAQAPYRELRLLHARAYRESAAQIRAGKIATQQQEEEFLGPRMIAARNSAFPPIAAMEQQALGDGKWTPTAAAAFREALADALEASR